MPISSLFDAVAARQRLTFAQLAAFTIALLFALTSHAQPSGRKGVGGGRAEAMQGKRFGEDAAAPSRDTVERRDHAIAASGLEAAFPDGHACQPIACPFASPTRYDGSRRPNDRNGGLHGGIDLSLSEGTPLLAVADGEVIALGEGGRMEGIYLWLRHSPEDTGLPYWVFSKYQHFSALPKRAQAARSEPDRPSRLRRRRRQHRPAGQQDRLAGRLQAQVAAVTQPEGRVPAWTR